MVLALLATAATTAFAGAADRRAGTELRGQRAGLATASLPRSHLTAFACHTAPGPHDRSISIRAVMRPVAGTKRMEMRFELLTRQSLGAAFVAQTGGGLGAWISPTDPTLGQRPGDIWIVPDLVRDLPAPGYYRYRVSFRWTGAKGRVLATRTRSSIECYQPLFHPDLLVSTVTIQPIPDKPNKDEYVAAIENDGPAPAAVPFAVTFTPAASALPGAAPVIVTKTIERLDAGATRTVAFVGPACSAAAAPTVVVDPDNTVGETDLTNNSLTVDPSCPTVTSAPASTPTPPPTS